MIENNGNIFLGLGTSNKDEFHGNETRSNAWGQQREIILIDMACPNESNKDGKREENIRKYQQLCFEMQEMRDGYKVKVIPLVIGC